MRLMITRPREDAEPLARELAALGVDSLIEPLLVVEPTGTEAPDLHGVQGLLLTSANGVRAFAAVSGERRLPVYAVGDATAREARRVGFETVHSASGDVDALAALVIEKCLPGDGPLLHVAGSKVAGDLGGRLEQAGYAYRRACLYHAARAETLSAAGLTAIEEGRVDGVLLYSPRTADGFVNLIGKAGLEGAARRMTAFCLSEAVADRVRALAWARVAVAETPDQAALLDRVREFSRLET